MHLFENRRANKQGADAGGVAKHLVKRNGNKFGLNRLQIEAIGWYICRRVKQHVQSAAMGLIDQIQ